MSSSGERSAGTPGVSTSWLYFGARSGDASGLAPMDVARFAAARLLTDAPVQGRLADSEEGALAEQEGFEPSVRF